MHAATAVCSHPKGKAAPQTLSFRPYCQFRLFIPFLSVLLPLVQVLMAPEHGMLGWCGCSLAGATYAFHFHGSKLLQG